MGPRAVDECEPSQFEIPERQEIFYKGFLYDVTDWIDKHPGGKIINYYTDGKEDATIPIQQFHHRSIKQVLAKMKSLPKRPAPPGYNPLGEQTERHRKLTEDFQTLFQDLLDNGFFKPSPSHVFCRYLEIVVYLGMMVYFLSFSDPLTKLIGIIFGAFAGSRCGWVMHEAGHMSLTGNSKYDRMLEIAAMNFGLGFSASCWSSQHNRHHAMPQRIHRDVDLDTLPLLAFNSKIAIGKKNGNSFFTRHQAKLFFTIDTLLVAMFWKFYLHPKYVIHKRKYGELLVMAAHYLFFFVYATNCSIGSYLLGTWLTSVAMFGNFTLSHTHMPVTTKNLHWVEYSLLHTSDIEPSWWCDWVMGYLNYQIEHHLFPTMPQFRQRQVVGRVRALAEKHGIPYSCLSYTEAQDCLIDFAYKVSPSACLLFTFVDFDEFAPSHER